MKACRVEWSIKEDQEEGLASLDSRAEAGMLRSDTCARELKMGMKVFASCSCLGFPVTIF